MKMIMNEYRLNLSSPDSQQFLMNQMEQYFFGEGSAFPPGYVPAKAKKLGGGVEAGQLGLRCRTATVMSLTKRRCRRARVSRRAQR